VTAIEPILKACGGTWIAQGSGNADRETVDQEDKLRVPPEEPHYVLKRIWIEKELEDGFYSGFSNEGLWPLCHIAHTRPIFRENVWTAYMAVNKKFALAVVKELDGIPEPNVLIQDYHFALLPGMIKAERPDARVAIFWHIPWPNPESFGICPWQKEILQGMLGADIVGFHTQFHCNNFVDTVDRQLEARVDRESFTVSFGGKLTAVRRYPISIEWPPNPELMRKDVATCRSDIRQMNGLPVGHKLGIGVDRLDYTKGIVERFRAIERLLELNPEWIGRFTFVQVAAPTRSGIEEYQHHETQVRDMAARILQEFPPDRYYYVGVGRSPTALIDFFRILDPGLACHLPASKAKWIRPEDVSGPAAEQVGSHLRRFLPDPEVLGDRKLLLIDHVQSGLGLNHVRTLVQRFWGPRAESLALILDDGPSDIDLIREIC